MRSVAVIGSGASGLVAALAAADAGAEVTVHERARVFGGTTSLSGGNAWLPGHAGMPTDDADQALTYLRSLDLGDTNDELLQVFAAAAGGTADWIEQRSGLKFQPIPYPDYHGEFPGGRTEGGRTLEPMPYDPSPELIATVREAPNVTAPITYQELVDGNIDRAALARRQERGTVTMGRALVAGLLQACRDAGVTVRTGQRITRRPEGVDAVIIATGGFERDEALVKTFLRGPMLTPVGAPGADGDGLRIAMAEGAALGNMSEAWWCGAITIPGEWIDGLPMSRLMLTERARPGCIVVNARGERFANEAQNYNDFGRNMQDFDAAAYRFKHVPAWMVFDASYRASYRLGPLGRRDPEPAWLCKAETIEALAEVISVPAQRLRQTVDRFNHFADEGRDPDFGRGSYPYDRFVGTLGSLGAGPYYAVRMLPGCLSTKGGPRTDGEGRVLSAIDLTPIPGLFAVGNAAASPFGMAYPGAGSTLGQGLVFGIRAGTAAAAD